MAKTMVTDPHENEAGYYYDAVAGKWVPIPGIQFDPSATGFAGGVDPSYKAPGKDKFNNPAQKYTYTTKDWQILLSMPKEQVISVQQQLMKAYPGFKPRALGDRTDPKTITYFKYALGRINQEPTLQGQEILTALPWMIANPLPISSSGTALPAFKLTNPVDLKTIFNKASQSVVGRQLDEADLNKLVTTYQAAELDYQKGKAAKSGAVIMPPDAGAFATKQILEENPAEASATTHADYIGALSKMMGA